MKQLPPFPCRFNFCNTPLLQEVQAPGLKFIWKKQFSMFFSLSRLYLTLATIKTSAFSTLGRCILKRVRFRYKNVCNKSFEKTSLSSLLSDWLSVCFLQAVITIYDNTIQYWHLNKSTKPRACTQRVYNFCCNRLYK